MLGNGNEGMGVIGRITITLLANGSVQAKAEGVDRNTMLMMLESSKFDLERIMREKETKKVQEAPPGILIPRG